MDALLYSLTSVLAVTVNAPLTLPLDPETTSKQGTVSE